jgi:hypothetical protein
MVSQAVPEVGRFMISVGDIHMPLPVEVVVSGVTNVAAIVGGATVAVGSMAVGVEAITVG